MEESVSTEEDSVDPLEKDYVDPLEIDYVDPTEFLVKEEDLIKVEPTFEVLLCSLDMAVGG